MASSTSPTLCILTAILLLLSPVLCQSNISTTSSATIVLPPPSHSDVPPPPLPTSCIINSLTSPDVRLTSFVYCPDVAKSLQFTLMNRMNGSTTICDGTGHGLITGDCSRNGQGSKFQYDSTTSMLTVTQLWICNDTTTIRPMLLGGTGNVTLDIHCSQDASNSTRCTAPPDIRIPISLSAPFYLTPAIQPPAAGHDNPGCTTKSEERPSWVISDFKWSTGGVEIPGFLTTTVVPRLVYQMNITNTATNATISCSTLCGGYIAANLTVPAQPTYMYGSPQTETPTWCPCQTQTQTKGTAYDNKYNTVTNMLVDPVKRILAIDQTWYCDDQNPKTPVQFIGSGQIPLPDLQCVPRPFDDINLNPDSVPTMQALVNGSTCSASHSFAITGNLTSRNKMDPYALQLPRPAQRSCTVSSVMMQRAMIRNYTYDLNAFEYSAYDTLNNSNSNHEPIGQLNFILMMQGLDVQMQAQGWDPRLNRQTKNYDPNYWLSCEQFKSVDPGSEGGIQHDDLQTGFVNFDAVNYVLRFNITWACSDINPDQRTVFQWITSVQLPQLNCYKDDDGGNRTHCLIPGNGTYDFWVNSSDEIRTITPSNNSTSWANFH